MFYSWIWELISVALTFGLVIAIAGLLALYDKKPAPDWGVHINLNALLALLSTLLRAMLVVIVSQVVSQKKWDWYKEEHARPLSDLQQFDSGSRSSLGALFLIPTIL
jgi:membrane protein YdbS with pleckstrin-like domain